MFYHVHVADYVIKYESQNRVQRTRVETAKQRRYILVIVGTKSSQYSDQVFLDSCPTPGDAIFPTAMQKEKVNRIPAWMKGFQRE